MPVFHSLWRFSSFGTKSGTTLTNVHVETEMLCIVTAKI
jgi:hypothetical protein